MYQAENLDACPEALHFVELSPSSLGILVYLEGNKQHQIKKGLGLQETQELKEEHMHMCPLHFRTFRTHAGHMQDTCKALAAGHWVNVFGQCTLIRLRKFITSAELLSNCSESVQKVASMTYICIMKHRAPKSHGIFMFVSV